MASRLPSHVPDALITSPAIEDYLYGLLPPGDGITRQIEAEASARGIPIVGPAVARLLFQLTRMIGARTVFELGSGIGYSTLFLAHAVGERGRVYFTDDDPERAERARLWFERAGVGGRIERLVGDAVELLAQRRGPFDVIFNDVEKQDYPHVFELAVPRLRTGGLFISDNVLWHGRVTARGRADATTRAVLEFNRLLYASEQLYTTILPLRDGVAVALKL